MQMPTRLPAGPYRTLTTVEGVKFPYYILPYDKDGICEGPQTLQHLLDHCAEYSDIFVFCHGWNNDWTTATRRYENFIQGFQELRRTLGLKMPDGYAPLLVGIFWPSQALEWFESETGPDIAAIDPSREDREVADTNRLLSDISLSLPPERRERFFELARAASLNKPEASELAGILAQQLTPDDEGLRTTAPSANDLLSAATALNPQLGDLDAVGTVAQNDGTPQAAFGVGDLFNALDPRNLLKPFTVWQMKDRAGKVGTQGVTKMLSGLLTRSTARMHILGHSFGCKVVMSATCSLPDGLRPLYSALLLQPAVSQYAFASEIPERPGARGGFVKALDRVTQPIVATFSANDNALTKLFHLALRRYEDLGEQPIIAGGPPSIYAALGGFGPQNSPSMIVPVQDAGQPYEFGLGGRIIGIEATRTIPGHGDVSNQSTWWLAYTVASGLKQ
jgi:hypothetical protein